MVDVLENTITEATDLDTEAVATRIYEVGYHLAPTVKEEELEGVVGGIRSVIEKAGGSFIAEGAPSLTRLAYPVVVEEKGRRPSHDRGYFGWIKFEVTIDVVEKLNAALKRSADVIRFIVFQTLREDTRAKIKAPTLRDVKRTDVIKQAPRHIEESSAPISDEDLEKALKDITEG